MCNHTFTRGSNTGKKCQIKPRQGDFCSKHRHSVAAEKECKKTCKYSFVKGINKGKMCSVCPRKGDFCSKHYVKKATDIEHEKKEEEIVVEFKEEKFNLENEIDSEVVFDYEEEFEIKETIVMVSENHGERCDICSSYFVPNNEKCQVCPNSEEHFMCERCFYAIRKAKCPFCRSVLKDEWRSKYMDYWKAKNANTDDYKEPLPWIFPEFDYDNWRLSKPEVKERYPNMDDYLKNVYKAYDKYTQENYNSHDSYLRETRLYKKKWNKDIMRKNAFLFYESDRLQD